MGWSPDDDARLVSLKRQGIGSREIAKQLGRSKSGCNEHYRELCLDSSEVSNGGEASQFSTEGNYAELTVTGKRVRSFEDLCAAFQIDLEVWECTFFEVGTYEGFAKNEDKNLTFTSGVIDGHAQTKGLIIAPMFRTKARFRRIIPVALTPVVQPIECPVTFKRLSEERTHIGSNMVISDIHAGFRRRLRDAKLIPFHDRGVLDIFLQACIDEQPEKIILLGDIADLAEMSDKFIKEPGFFFATQPMLLEVHWWLRQLREGCPSSEIWFHQGSHDARIDKTILTHLVSVYGLRAADEMELPPQLSLPRLLALDSLDINWSGDHPDDDLWLSETLRARHGNKVGSAPGATARTMLDSATVSTIFAHVHRQESASKVIRTASGSKTIHAYGFGCGCYVDGRVPGHSRDYNWQQGFGRVQCVGDLISATSTEVIEGKAIWDGAIYAARDRVPDLKRDLPDWNW